LYDFLATQKVGRIPTTLPLVDCGVYYILMMDNGEEKQGDRGGLVKVTENSK